LILRDAGGGRVPEGREAGGRASSPSPECVVCVGSPQKGSLYCPRCRRSVQHRDLRAGALREAWGRGGSSAVAPGRSRPTPGAPGPSTAGTLVVAAWWGNEDRDGRE